MDIKVIMVKTEEELNECCCLRREVFGKEENAPKALYIVDDNDRQETTKNYLLKVGESYVATVRFVEIDKEIVKLQRLVVLKEYRKKGYAKILLNNLENDVKKFGYKKIIMDSALNAVGFYEKCGYVKVSDVFYEDNRPHVKMEKKMI